MIRKILATTMLCGLSFNLMASESCEPQDAGYNWSSASVEFEKNTSAAFCRVIGNGHDHEVSDWRIRCTIRVYKTGECKTKESEYFPDMGYENTQFWADKNGDGFIDFCRSVGDKNNPFRQCRLGPDFKTELDVK
jgi:hypothetical protein